jgi:hypothetical protein
LPIGDRLRRIGLRDLAGLAGPSPGAENDPEMAAGEEVKTGLLSGSVETPTMRIRALVGASVFYTVMGGCRHL